MTKSITINDHTFQIQTPYAEGPHHLSAAEAKTLNQVRTERLRTTLTKMVNRASGDEDLVARAAEIDANYNYGETTTRERVDPVEREARSLAREQIKLWLESDEGGHRRIADVDKARLQANIEQVAQNPDIVRLARRRLADRQKAATPIVASLDFGPN